MSAAEHTVVVYKKDSYRFQEYRSQYQEYAYFQCFQTELIDLGIVGFFVKVVEEEPQEPTRIYDNPNILTGYPLGMVH